MKRKIVAEALGTAFLLAAVVGSGIMGDRLSQGNVAIALLVNTIATGATLAALILTFSSISGAHFNPAVTLAAASLDEMPWKQVPSYIAAQNRRSAERCRYRTHHVWAAPVLELSSCKARLRTRIQRICRHLWIAQCDLGLQPISLLGSCLCCRRIYYRRLLVHGVHCFANPAVTLARSLSDTFAGIAPSNGPAFIAAQLLGAGAATALFRWLTPARSSTALGREEEEIANA